MKKWLSLILAMCLLTGCSNGFQQIQVDRTSTRTTHAVWVSYLDYAELLGQKDQDAYTTSIKTLISNCESLGINTIYFQVSAFTDAYYQSQYYPYSNAITGTLGGNPGYDPLQILVSEASMRNIETVAWINPLRSFSVDTIALLPMDNPIRQWYEDEEERNANLMLVNERYYLNPGSEQVLDLVCAVARELLENYSVTGLHVDDAFYPEGLADEADTVTYERYKQVNPDTPLADYRRSKSDLLVQRLYKAAHNAGKTFSISPSADFTRNRDVYFCDVEKWISKTGYCDTVIPQVYYGFDHETMPFKDVVNEWEEKTNGRIRLIFGLAGYKIGQVDEYAGSGFNEWVENADVLSRQVRYLKQLKHCDGEAFYRYASLFRPDEKKRKQVQMELTRVRSELGVK